MPPDPSRSTADESQAPTRREFIRGGLSAGGGSAPTAGAIEHLMRIGALAAAIGAALLAPSLLRRHGRPERARARGTEAASPYT